MLNDLAERRDFVMSTAGRAVSAFGDEVAVIALTLRLQGHHGRPWEIAMLLGADLLPIVLLARWAGRLVDRRDSRQLLVVASAAQAGCCLALVFAQQAATVIVLAGLLGVGTAVAKPTWQALLPRMAGDEHVGRATALQQGTTAIAMIGAPAAGGLLTGAFGSAIPLAIDAASFVVMAAAGALIRTRRMGDAHSGQDAAGAWSVLRTDPVLALLSIGLVAFVLITMMVSVVEVFLVRVTLHAGSAWYGTVMAVWIFGIIGGTLATGRIGTDDRRLVSAAAGALAISAALCGYGVVPAVWALLPLALVGGAGNGALNSCTSAVITSRTPEQLRGRVSAAVGAMASAASIVSLMLGGVVGSLLPPRSVLLIAGGLGVLTAGTAVAWWRSNARDRGLF